MTRYLWIFLLLVAAAASSNAQQTGNRGVPGGPGSSVAGVSSIAPGTNVTCTPLVNGTCSGPVTVSSTASGSSGLSGMAANQVPIAATANTVTSSKALAGTGAAITTGPSSATSGDVATFSGSSGQVQDSGVAIGSAASNLLQLDSSDRIPGVSGVLLQSLNASNLSSGTVPAAQMPALTGDCVTTAGAVATICTKTNGTTFGTAATQNTGTSGSSIPLNNGANTESGATTFSAAGAASTPGVSVTGAPYTGGTSTTNFPQLYINQGSAVTTLSTAGTEFGINAPSGFVGHLINLFINGGSTVFRVDYAGDLFTAGYHTIAANSGASQAAVTLTGTPYTGGTSTTDFPVLYLNNGAAAAVTTLSASGTELAINAPSGFVGNMLDCHVNGGSSVCSIDYRGGFIGRTYSVNTSGAGMSGSATNVSVLINGGNTQAGGAVNSGNLTLLGSGANSGTGSAGNVYTQAGANTSTGLQGFANTQQSFTIAAATTVGYVMAMASTSDVVQAAALGSVNNIGVATTVGGTGTQIYVATEGKIPTVFDGTPVVGHLVCAPPTVTGTSGLAHDNGSTACPAGQKLGVVTGQVSGTGSGATATVLLQLGS